MTPQSFFSGLIRHTGYALLVLGGLLIAAEALIPAFSTPYTNPYLLLGSGIFCALIGGWRVTAFNGGRWGIGLLFSFLLLVVLFSQLSFSEQRFAWLGVATLILMVAFFLASVYPEFYE